MADLIIKISGDIKEYEDSLQKALEKTESLNTEFQSMAKVGGALFAALTAEIGLATKAFSESEAVSRKLSQALQNQGIFSEQLVETYKKQSAALQEKTGIDDDAILSGISLLQGFMGQKQVSQELAEAMVDLSTKTGSVESAAQLLGKAFNGNTRGLGQFGIAIDENLSKQERMDQVLKRVSQQLGGQAKAANDGLGSIKGLTSAFGDFQENIGERFAPMITAGIKIMTQFFQLLNNNPAVADFVSSVLFAGSVVSGLTLAVGLAGMAYLQLSASLQAAKVATTAMSIATKGLVGATGIGLLLIVVSELYLNWSSIWPKMQAAYTTFVDNIGAISSSFADILKAAFKFDREGIKAAWEEIKNIASSGYEDYNAILENEEVKQVQHHEKQNEAAKKAAQERAAIENAAALDASAQRDVLREEILASNEAFQAMSVEQQTRFMQQDSANLANQLTTERTAKAAAAKLDAAERIKNHNQYLVDQQNFGTAYATINKIMHSEVYNGTKKAFANMSAMQQSQNSTLKAIGKAAAIANIITATAESAMNIYKGFSTIPFVGPALGIAGAAAAVAFGGEQIGRVISAADGGLITGGIPGIDSVPVMAQAGELIVPKQNFNDVVKSYASSKLGLGEGSNAEPQEAPTAHLVISFQDNLMDFIEAKLVERSWLGISLQRA